MLDKLIENPVVAAVKNAEGLDKALRSPCPVVFVLFGDVCGISELVGAIKRAGKTAVVHIDLIDGLSNREVSARFLRSNTAADGIISTKSHIIRSAKELGLITVQRFFIWDSMSLENVQKNISGETADFIEILPGVIPKAIEFCVKNARLPVIAGGLISTKSEVVSALGAGATAISTTQQNLWLEN